MVYEVRLGKPNHPTPLPPQRREIDTETLPYCIWHLRDGREILVNRKGASIWERMPGRPARRSDPLEHVVGIVDKDYLYAPLPRRRWHPVALLAADTGGAEEKDFEADIVVCGLEALH
jgi:hypothetical protein